MPKTRVAYIDGKVQYGKGRAASVLGQTYNLWRLSDKSNGSVISGKPLFANVPLYLEKTSKSIVENQIFDLIAYEGVIDNRRLQKQDIFVETGYETDFGTYIFAQRRPVPPYKSIFMRAETYCFITRPYTAAGAVAQQPPSGVLVQPAYGGTTKGIEKYLTLNDGLYTFSEEAVAGASIPCGIQPLNRVRDGSIPNVATKQYRTHHLVYVPLIPGEQLNEQDRINASASDRYEIMEVHSTDETGLSGYICIVEKLAT
jgi:hypothetical protein